jgi:hypothetical protein
MKKAIQITIIVLAGIVASGAISIWVFGRLAASVFTEAVNKLERGPIQNPTEAAVSYMRSLEMHTVVMDTKVPAVSCTVANVGGQAISQLVVQINLLDKQGKLLTTEQGPVIGREDSGRVTIGNAFSHFEGPLLPGTMIVFQHSFPDLVNEVGLTITDPKLIDIAFAPSTSAEGSIVPVCVVLALLVAFLIVFRLGKRRLREAAKAQTDQFLRREEAAVKVRQEAQELLKQAKEAQDETNRLLRQMINKE